jgi:opacity protein-like surface antigen
MTRFPGVAGGAGGVASKPNEGTFVMAKLRLVAIAGAVAATCGWANAADLPPAPLLPAASPPIVEFSGWYLRGDVGLGINATAPELQIAPDPIALGFASGFQSSGASQAFNNTTLSPFGMIDVGAGYRFNDWVRVDGTFEYRGGADLQSLYTLTDPASPDFGGTFQRADFYRANVSSFIGLINGYVNLGTWSGLSPFVGAGVGVADNKVSGFTDQGYANATFASPGPTGGYFSNGSKTAFAWALMAGLDFDISPNLKLELGYRYLNYGSITTGGSSCLAGNSGGTFNGVKCSGGVANFVSSRDRLASNDFRLGLIYTLRETPPLPPM